MWLPPRHIRSRASVDQAPTFNKPRGMRFRTTNSVPNTVTSSTGMPTEDAMEAPCSLEGHSAHRPRCSKNLGAPK